MNVSIELIKPSLVQTRSNYNEDSITELAESIKQCGILEPLLVREVNGGLELIAGHRRLEAAKQLGRKTVPVIIKKLTDGDVLFVQLIENIQREQISDFDVGKIFSELTAKDFTQQQIADKIGFSIRRVRQLIEHYRFCTNTLGTTVPNVDCTALKESQTRDLRTEDHKLLVQKVIEKWEPKPQVTKGDLRQIWREIRTTNEGEQRADIKDFLQEHDYLTSVVAYDERGQFGDSNFHGNSPPLLLVQLINLYKPKSIYDPMEGGFTNRDVCQAMDIDYVGNDLNNTSGYDLATVEDKVILENDLTFFHPPYWDLIKYSTNANDLSNAKTWDDFLNLLKTCIDKLLKKTKLLVLLIGDVPKNDVLYTPLTILSNYPTRLIRILVHEYTVTTGLHSFYKTLAEGKIPIKHDYAIILKGDLIG